MKLALSLLVWTAATPELSGVLTLDRAEALALERHPSVRQAAAAVDAARARATAARAPLLPDVSAQATYQRTTANFSPRPGSVPSQLATAGAASLETYNWFSAGATANLMVWDFGRTLGRYRSAQALARAQESTKETTRDEVAVRVRAAFFNARAQRALLDVAQSTLKNEERHLAQIRGFVEVGTRPEIDLAQARTAVANARLLSIRAENAYAVAKAQLNQAMGLVADIAYEVADQPYPPVPGEDAPTSQLVAEALSARPELQAVLAQLDAQAQSVRAAEGGYWPSLGVSASLTETGRQLDQMAWNLGGQVSLSWPLFQGFSTTAQAEEARALVVSLEAQRELLQLQLRLEVEQARLSVRAAAAAISAAEEALESSRQRLRLAEGRYQTGLGSIIELGDAQLAVSNAAAQRVQVEYELATARSQLARALGR